MEYVKHLLDSAAARVDAAAHTATFNSEAVDLSGCDFFGLYLDVGTVSGTSPTCNIKVQSSFDGGSNWVDFYPDDLTTSTQATIAEITTTSADTGAMFARYMPSLKPGRNPGVTGADEQPVPVVRFVFTIAGTSPSFTFTRAHLVQIVRRTT